MTKDECSARKLCFSRANAICRNIVGIGDHVFSYAEALKLSGFSAFEPYLRFVDGFCDTKEATNLHRACLIEVAKVSLGTHGRCGCVPLTQREQAFTRQNCSSAFAENETN
jgi:hypothetical protein